jgi:hypothetical protein
MTLLSELLKSVVENWKLLASSFLVLGAGLIFVRTFYAWYRLRHIKGPFLASFSKLWLIRTVSSGNMHWEYAKVCQKYGTHDAAVPVWCSVEIISLNSFCFIGSLARVGPNQLVTSDPEQMRKMLSARSLYRRSDWYVGMRFDPSHENVESERNDDRHTELRAKMAAGVSFLLFQFISTALMHQVVLWERG